VGYKDVFKFVACVHNGLISLGASPNWQRMNLPKRSSKLAYLLGCADGCAKRTRRISIIV